MTIQEALNLSDAGIAEAYWDGYTIVVRENENENYEDVLTFSVSVGAMPPHHRKNFKTVGEVEQEIKERSAFPASILNDFEPVNEDEEIDEDEEEED